MPHHASKLDFNPRSRKGSDNFRRCFFASNRISIHAPARGATSVKPNAFAIAPFQPTLPQGERLDVRPCQKSCTHISIHAPARGATQLYRPFPGQEFHFNPRSRKGSDPTLPPIPRAGVSFQSTLPQGERLVPTLKEA